MIIHGREVNFALTVGSSTEISELCPDGNIERVGELFETSAYGKQVRSIAKLVCALSRGYETAKKYEEKANGVDYAPNPLTIEELTTLTPDDFNAVALEAFACLSKDRKTTVETEQPKKAEPKAE